jgi:DNA mismatch repair protein MutS
MPRTLVLRAEEVLESLESARSGDKVSSQDASMPRHQPPDLSTISPATDGMQMSFFQLDDPALESIRDQLMEVDIDHLTPVQALMKLHEIKATLKGKKG